MAEKIKGEKNKMHANTIKLRKGSFWFCRKKVYPRRGKEKISTEKTTETLIKKVIKK